MLAGALDLSLIDQNAMLVTAGFAPVHHKNTTLEAPELVHVRKALDFILKQHEPYPAVVVDGGWNTIMRNEGAGRILQLFLETGSLDGAAAGNAMHMICHPDGLRRFTLISGAAEVQ